MNYYRNRRREGFFFFRGFRCRATDTYNKTLLEIVYVRHVLFFLHVGRDTRNVIETRNGHDRRPLNHRRPVIVRNENRRKRR